MLPDRVSNPGVCCVVMHPKDVDGIANSVELRQSAPLEQSDLGLHFLLSPVCLHT